MLDFMSVRQKGLILNYHYTLDERTELIVKPKGEVLVKIRGHFRGDHAKIKALKTYALLSFLGLAFVIPLVFFGISGWGYLLFLAALLCLSLIFIWKWANLSLVTKILRIDPHGFCLELNINMANKDISVFRSRINRPLLAINHHIPSPTLIPRRSILMKELSVYHENHACLWLSEKAYASLVEISKISGKQSPNK